MESNIYQQQAMTTCLPSSNNLAYMLFGLLGEVAELIEKLNVDYQDKMLGYTSFLLDSSFGHMAKVIRKTPDTDEARLFAEINDFLPELKEQNLDGIIGEIGDCFWMLNGLMTVLGISADDVLQYNLDKLASRKKRDVIDGDGDNR